MNYNNFPPVFRQKHNFRKKNAVLHCWRMVTTDIPQLKPEVSPPHSLTPANLRLKEFLCLNTSAIENILTLRSGEVENISLCKSSFFCHVKNLHESFVRNFHFADKFLGDFLCCKNRLSENSMQDPWSFNLFQNVCMHARLKMQVFAAKSTREIFIVWIRIWNHTSVIIWKTQKDFRTTVKFLWVFKRKCYTLNSTKP